LAPSPRGFAIEPYLGHNTPPNLRTIDKVLFNETNGLRDVTSIKSINLSDKTYSYPASGTPYKNIVRVGKGYVNKVLGFNGARSRKYHFSVGEEEIGKRGLDLAVPYERTSEQTRALLELLSYAEEKGLELRIYEVK